MALKKKYIENKWGDSLLLIIFFSLMNVLTLKY